MNVTKKVMAVNKIKNLATLAPPVSKICIDFKKLAPGSPLYDLVSKFRIDNEK